MPVVLSSKTAKERCYVRTELKVDSYEHKLVTSVTSTLMLQGKPFMRWRETWDRRGESKECDYVS